MKLTTHFTAFYGDFTWYQDILFWIKETSLPQDPKTDNYILDPEQFEGMELSVRVTDQTVFIDVMGPEDKTYDLNDISDALQGLMPKAGMVVIAAMFGIVARTLHTENILALKIENIAQYNWVRHWAQEHGYPQRPTKLQVLVKQKLVLINGEKCVTLQSHDVTDLVYMSLRGM